MLYSLCNRCGERIPYREKYCDKCLPVVMEEKQHKYKIKSNKYYSDRYKKDKEHDSYRLFYSSSAWKNKRKEILDKYDYRCAICSELYNITPATDIHHILNLRDHYDLRLENDNLIPLCVEHHKIIHTLGLNNKEKIQKYIELEKEKDKHIKALESMCKYK